MFIDIKPFFIPELESASYESVPQVVDTDVRMTTAGFPAKLLTQIFKGVLYFPGSRWSTMVEHEEGIGGRVQELAVALQSVTT